MKRCEVDVVCGLFPVQKRPSDIRIFRTGVGIVGHQLDGTVPGKRGKGSQICLCVGDARDQWNADDVRFSACLQVGKICVYRFT